MPSSESDPLLAALAEIEQLDSRQREAFELINATFMDDPVDPSVAATVWQGKLAHLELTDSVCRLPPQQAADRINGVIINAFGAWREALIDHINAL